MYYLTLFFLISAIVTCMYMFRDISRLQGEIDELEEKAAQYKGWGIEHENGN